MWTSTQTSEAMVPNHFVPLVPTDEVLSLGKGKLNIRPIIFAKCVFFLFKKKLLFGRDFQN